ncbi:MAG: TatD family hydrolase [Ethanoligenens sp.]|uniref:TatD family hydrolase n=1 Tax=Ethanoligenens sp. TaxID=2099655 RepID=UPI0039EB2F3D
MDIFDSHAHYTDEAFDADRAAVLGGLPAAGITGVLNAGTSVATSTACIKLAKAYPFCHAAVGVHPEDVADAAEGDFAEIARLTASFPVVAIGEIGLDYHWDVPRDLQKKWFADQLALANEMNLPVIVHDREAHADTLAFLQKYRPRGVVHCYSGSVETARELLKLGLYLGFTGAVTFKNNQKARAVLASLPHDRVLCETDCPYMAPEPLRGRRCDSMMLTHTLACIADVMGLPVEEAAHITANNARALFGLDKGDENT